MPEPPERGGFDVTGPANLTLVSPWGVRRIPLGGEASARRADGSIAAGRARSDGLGDLIGVRTTEIDPRTPTDVEHGREPSKADRGVDAERGVPRNRDAFVLVDPGDVARAWLPRFCWIFGHRSPSSPGRLIAILAHLRALGCESAT